MSDSVAPSSTRFNNPRLLGRHTPIHAPLALTGAFATFTLFVPEHSWYYAIALVVGLLSYFLPYHPYRQGRWLVYTPLVAALGLIAIWRAWLPTEYIAIALGLAYGNTLRAAFHLARIWAPPQAKIPMLSAAAIGAALGLALEFLPPSDRLTAVVACMIVQTIHVCLFAMRLGFEGTIEYIFMPMYRFRVVGMKPSDLPERGPCLVIANHAAWLDPLWLAKIMPPPTVPMMTSSFYDLPGIRFLMRNLIGTIRVPEKKMRRDAPELDEAIAALDRGECVLIFPEGYLRRKENQPLKRFGRGIWQILSQRPGTPVYACWIEGSWGSFWSHRGGVPTKNKKPDLLRKISIGVVGPILPDTNLIHDHHAIRKQMMEAVLTARAALGKDPLEVPMPIIDDSDDDKPNEPE